MIIWSTVVAGCGIMALLGRQAAIYRFGTDEFTGNILFAVFFILLIGLYFSIQPVFEAIFKRLFPQRTPALMVAEMPNGEHIALPTNNESLEMMQCTSPSTVQEYDVCEDDVEFADDSVNNEFQVLETHDGLRHIRFTDGSEAYVGEGLSDEEVMTEKAYFDVRVNPQYSTPVGCFSSIGFENHIPHENGKFIIEHEEHDVYISADGQPYFLTELEEALKTYEVRKEHGDIPEEILVQKKQCETAHKELQEEDMKFSLAQIEFLCAYITHMMQISGS